MGGALLEKVPKEGEGMKIEGSAMVAWAASKEEVIETLKKDIYAESGVWDFSKVSEKERGDVGGRWSMRYDGSVKGNWLIMWWCRFRFIRSSVRSARRCRFG